jgi:PEP-CTERM motif
VEAVKTALGLLTVALVTLCPLASAESVDGLYPYAQITDPGSTQNFSAPPGPYTIGWSFQVLNPISVAYLGYFTPTGSLTDAHDVAIYQCTDSTCTAAAGPAIVSGTVTPSDPLQGSFLWQSVAPTTLVDGYYAIGGFAGDNDPYVNALSGSNVAFDPNVQFDNGVYTPSSGLTFPGLGNPPGSSISYFGPNFANTPEPSTLLLSGLALLGLLLRYSLWKPS